MISNSSSTKLDIVAKTSVGMVRGNNEDYHGFSTNLADKEWRFYENAVCWIFRSPSQLLFYCFF